LIELEVEDKILKIISNFEEKKIWKIFINCDQKKFFIFANYFSEVETGKIILEE
jgi:hypothetical protein